MPRNSPERDLAKACTELLQFDGWRAIPMEPISRREWGKGTGEIGQPDYLYIRYTFNDIRFSSNPAKFEAENRADAEVLWCEFKSRRGRVSAGQRLWHDVERKRGALTALAKVDFKPTVDGFWAWYQATGLVRRIQGSSGTVGRRDLTA